MSQQRVLDNPNDIAIREQQKQYRLEQGAADAKRKAEEKALVTEYSESFTFRFRKIKNGSFSGLWELAALKSDPKAKVDEIISDADALPHVLEAIGNIFANRGF